MRDKTNQESTEKEAGGVADGFDFSVDIEEEEVTVAEPKAPEPTVSQPKRKTAPKKAEIDPDRNYSKYYTPKPKKGAKGGTLGRGAVEAEERKVQFSLTCTQAQKDRFKEAADKDKRKLPDFICLAVEEYIEKHNL